MSNYLNKDLLWGKLGYLDGGRAPGLLRTAPWPAEIKWGGGGGGIAYSQLKRLLNSGSQRARLAHDKTCIFGEMSIRPNFSVPVKKLDGKSRSKIVDVFRVCSWT